MSGHDVAGIQSSQKVVDQQPSVAAASARTPMIVVQGLKKSYGFKPILRRLDLVVPDGGAMALLGSNGAGKTTFLRVLAGLIKPDAGVVCIAGMRLSEDIQQIRRTIGFVAHQTYLYEELTVLENLLFFGRLYGVEHLRERSEALIQRLGLQKKMHDRVHALSRGQAQRAAWARALLHEPSLLLLDEPDTGMDQDGHELMLELLQEHRERGGSMLFTTHHQDLALRLSQDLVILSGGRLVYQGVTADLDADQLHRIYAEVAR